MTADWKALCADLLRELDHASAWDYQQALKDQARAALAQPEPEGPTDEALAVFTAWFCKNYPGPDTLIHRPEWHAPKVFRAAADAITRFGRPTPQSADGEVAELANSLRHSGDALRAYGLHGGADDCHRAADLLERLSPPQPIPVSERLPGPEDCDADGEVWAWRRFDPEGDMDNGDHWCLAFHEWLEDEDCGFTYWLPAHALPGPGEAVE